MKYLIFLFCAFFNTLLYSQSVIINEIMSSNSSIIQDEDGDYPDWIEIYNPNDTTVNLFSFSLSDEFSNPSKWILPNISIQPKKFLLIFASGKNRVSGTLHTNFKIKSSGEQLWLRDSFGQIIDHIDSVKIPTNISYGRNNYNIGQWLFYNNPTPGTANTTHGFIAIAEPPIFSQKGGFFNSSQSITFQPNQNIYFTLDGSDPDTSSNLYSTAIIIDSTTVIRARKIKDNYLPSKIITNTYFINENITLPVISLSTNPNNFWDDEVGIYVVGTNGRSDECNSTIANYKQDWERPIHIEFFEKDKNLAFSIDAGIKIHGGCTRRLNQKSLAIIARGKYGSNAIPYNLFPSLQYKEYQSFLLRSSGNDNGKTLLRDALTHDLVKKIDLENQAYRPAIIFLNGNYFGCYNIRERTNDNYIYQHHHVDNKKIDFMRHEKDVIRGKRTHYDSLFNFIRNSDLSIDENYRYVSSQMEIDNYVNYLLTEMYCVNTDWYPGNTKFWRPQTKLGRWRWILFDTDFGFGLTNNDHVSIDMLSRIQRQDKYPSVIINGLLQNENFRIKFINTFADFSNTIFYPQHVVSVIDSFKNILMPEIPRSIKKWGNISSFSKWLTNIEDVKNFVNNRLKYMTQHFKNEFNLDSTVTLKLDVNNIGGGYVHLNSIDITKFPWSGKYFSNIPVKLTAQSNLGYKFLHWKNNDVIISTSAEFILSVNSNKTITAIFEKTQNNSKSSVVINEINYNSSSDFDTEDWIELYNNSEYEINISNWIFKDNKDNHQFRIPGNTFLKANKFLVLCRDTSAFDQFFNNQANPVVTNFIGNFEFKLSSKGELIRLYDSNGTLVDSVIYDNAPPWPTEPNGNGPTLELLNPNFDNAKAESWGFSNNHGSPGKQNDSNVVNIKNEIVIPSNYFLQQNYPNPFNPTTTIQFGLPKSTFVQLSVYNIIGEKIQTLVSNKLTAGLYNVKFNGTNLSSGIYLYRIKTEGFSKTLKLILIK